MIEVYTHEQHYDRLRSWLSSHDMKAPEKHLLPDIGLCVDGKAIGFLLTTNSSQAYLDTFAADPRIDQSLRDGALRTLTNALIEIAQKKSIKFIQALTCLPTMKHRFTDMDFKRIPDNYVIFYKFLTGGN